MPHPSGRRAFTGFMAGALLGAPALARAAATPALPVPAGEVILDVSGSIATTNAPGAARFDRAMLEALGQASFTTATPWYPNPVTFEGVPAMRLMEAVQARGTTVTAIALNDYSTEIPISDFARYDVLLALKRDGLEMPVRDKGPIFIVYPFDSDADLRNRRYYGRSAWQVSRLIIS